MNIYKKYKKLILILGLIVLAPFVTYTIDSKLIAAENRPIFVIKGSIFLDGGTTIYYGLGYQIIKWNRLSSRTINGSKVYGLDVGYEIYRFPFYKDINHNMKPEKELNFISR